MASGPRLEWKETKNSQQPPCDISRLGNDAKRFQECNAILEQSSARAAPSVQLTVAAIGCILQSTSTGALGMERKIRLSCEIVR
jgi:hypothetical protein